jgi:hypothetical protein
MSDARTMQCASVEGSTCRCLASVDGDCDVVRRVSVTAVAESDAVAARVGDRRRCRAVVVDTRVERTDVESAILLIARVGARCDRCRHTGAVASTRAARDRRRHSSGADGRGSTNGRVGETDVVEESPEFN